MISIPHHRTRVGIYPSVLQDDQMRSIMQHDHVDEEEGGTWYIMDSAWVESWLGFAYMDKDVGPAPGPCRNHRLIEWNYAQNRYQGRWGLVMAVKERAGDYRRVSKEAWEQFCTFYPGSGPAITMEFVATDMNESGFYDVSKWNILDPPPPPEDKNKKKKKKGFFGKGKKKDGSDPADEMKAGDATAPATSVDVDTDRENHKSSNISSLLGMTKNEPKMNYQKVDTKSSAAEGNNAGPTTDKTGLLNGGRASDADQADADGAGGNGEEGNMESKDSSSRRESFFEGVYFGKD
jgi:hypothetical protein